MVAQSLPQRTTRKRKPEPARIISVYLYEVDKRGKAPREVGPSPLQLRSCFSRVGYTPMGRPPTRRADSGIDEDGSCSAPRLGQCPADASEAKATVNV